MPDVDLTPFAGYRMGVSRRHIVIRQSEDTRLDILDLGSSNGTYVNGQKLTPNQPQRLRDGDELRLGQMVMRIFFQKPLTEESPTIPKPPVAEASNVPAPAQSTGTPPVVTQPGEAKPIVPPPPVVTQPGDVKPIAPPPPVVTQPGDVKPIVPPSPVIVQPPQVAPAAGTGNSDKSATEEPVSPPGTANLPPLPTSPNGPDVQADPSGTRILQDPDAKP
jgi:predicted component of type VI protein secretion system